MDKTPFKMRGFSGFGNSPMTKKSPTKDTDPHTEGHTHETKEVDPDAYEKILLQQSDEGKKPLNPTEEKILGKYRSRKFKNKK